MVQLDDWKGLLKDSRVNSADTNLKIFVERSTRGGSGAFMGVCEVKQRYWIKPLNNSQGHLVPITEQIVGRVARLIGAATCKVKTVEISEDFAGQEFKQGKQIEAGIAHGSLSVDDIVDVSGLNVYRKNDDNQRRHTTIFALYDWCWGDDMQGLCKTTNDYQFFSHDHGHYLRPEGRDWTVESLRENVDKSHELSQSKESVTSTDVNEIIKQLESVTRDQLIEVLSYIPRSWPVNDEALETVGWFLEYRIPGVVQRIKQQFGVLI